MRGITVNQPSGASRESERKTAFLENGDLKSDFDYKLHKTTVQDVS